MRPDRPKGWLPHAPGELPEYEPRFGLDTPNSHGEWPRAPWTDLIQVGLSCTWNGAACAEYGFTGEKNSPYPGYWASRARKHPDIAADKNGRMPNEGLSLFDILDSFGRSGTCQWDLWGPGTPGFSIYTRPPWVARVDSQRHNFDVSVLAATGNALFAGLACGIDRTAFALLALDVDEEFERFKGSGIIGKQSGPSLGGHLVPVWSHKWDDGEANIGNYWRDWGNLDLGGNIARISADRIAQARYGFLIQKVGL